MELNDFPTEINSCDNTVREKFFFQSNLVFSNLAREAAATGKKENQRSSKFKYSAGRISNGIRGILGRESSYR